MHVKNGEFRDVTSRILEPEGVKVVKEVVGGVTSLKVGDRASVVWFFEGSGHCKYCVTGRETLCRSAKKSCFTVDGSSSDQCIVTADYAVEVPDGLSSEAASSVQE